MSLMAHVVELPVVGEIAIPALDGCDGKLHEICI